MTIVSTNSSSSAAVQKLLSAIRKACPPALWAQGDNLARGDAVLLERATSDEIVVRVNAPEWSVPPTVVLYTETTEWACDCGGTTDACAHVAAAVLAITAAQKNGVSVRSAASVRGRLSYRLGRTNSVLT